MTTIDLVNLGSAPNDGTGDTLRAAGAKINTNFTNLNNELNDVADPPQNTVFVNNEADLGAISNGVIQMADNTAYIMHSPVSTARTIVPGSGSRIIDPGHGVNSLTFTGSNAFQTTDLDGAFRIRNCVLNMGATTQVFDITSVGTAGFVSMDDTDILGNGYNLGTLSNTNFAVQRMSVTGFGTGITFSGGVFAATSFGNWQTTADTTIFTFEGAFVGANTVATQTLSTGSGGSALNLDSGLTAGGIDIISNTYSGGTFLESGSLDQNMSFVTALGNTGLPDSVSIGQMVSAGNINVTNITAIDTPVPVVATTTAGFLSRFTHASGALTYVGIRDIIVDVTVAAQVDITGANAGDVYSFYIYVNGVQQAVTRAQQTLGAIFGSPVSPTFMARGILELSSNDVVTVRVENNTSDNDIVVSNINTIVQGIA